MFRQTRNLLVIATIICSTSVLAQTWTTRQLNIANTARNIKYLTQAEKDAIMYINLARLYPFWFNVYELKNYEAVAKNSTYKTSLMYALFSLKPMHALYFDKELYEDAKCYAKESGDLGITGHDRKICEKSNYSECCDYGNSTGLGIAISWLIDQDVPSLGHRLCCLDHKNKKIGLSVHPHKTYGICAVAEFDE